jgi:hypothetical protein
MNGNAPAMIVASSACTENGRQRPVMSFHRYRFLACFSCVQCKYCKEWLDRSWHARGQFVFGSSTQSVAKMKFRRYQNHRLAENELGARALGENPNSASGVVHVRKARVGRPPFSRRCLYRKYAISAENLMQGQTDIRIYLKSCYWRLYPEIAGLKSRRRLWNYEYDCDVEREK